MDHVDNEEFRRRVLPATRLLRRAPREFDRLGERRGWSPGDLAPATAEWALRERNAAYSAAFSFFVAAGDQMRGAARLIDSRAVAVWAPMSLGRATLEIAARAWWILEPDLDPDTRLARGYLFWLLALGATGKIADLDVQATAASHADLARRLSEDDVGHDVTDGHVTKIHGVHWEGAGAVLPGMYEEGAAYASRVYGWLCGVSHGDPWVLAESFRTGDVSSQRRQIHPVVTSAHIAVLTKAMVLAYASAADRWSALMDWDPTWQRVSSGLRSASDDIVELLT